MQRSREANLSVVGGPDLRGGSSDSSASLPCSRRLSVCELLYFVFSEQRHLEAILRNVNRSKLAEGACFFILSVHSKKISVHE
jgi:hypothetical protein